jgi:cytoskeletal protein CcmA (bactofilin family)
VTEEASIGGAPAQGEGTAVSPPDAALADTSASSGTRVDFYVTQSDAPRERLRVACRVVEKAFQAGHTVLVWHTDIEELRDGRVDPHGRNRHDLRRVRRTQQNQLPRTDRLAVGSGVDQLHARRHSRLRANAVEGVTAISVGVHLQSPAIEGRVDSIPHGGPARFGLDETGDRGEGAQVEGEIDVGTVIIKGGTVSATVRAAQAIELYVPAVVSGSLHSPEIFMDKGVLFSGSCTMAPLESPEGT